MLVEIVDIDTKDTTGDEEKGEENSTTGQEEGDDHNKTGEDKGNEDTTTKKNSLFQLILITCMLLLETVPSFIRKKSKL